jgi:type I restriction enzyme, R subunit
MQNERHSQNRLIQLFQKELGYAYLGNLYEEENTNFREADSMKYLNGKYTDKIINRAIFEFKKVSTINASDDLYKANKAVYSLLRYGIPIKEEAGKNKETVYLIDWENPLNNHFAIAEEVTIKSQFHSKRPDIVLYINGIAIGVLELKRSTVGIEEGIRQNLDNQKDLFIRPFFSTIQLALAGNDTQGLRYGTIATKEKYYLKWKEVNEQYNANDSFLLSLTQNIRNKTANYDNPLDRNIIELLNKERLIEMLYHFVVFDRGQKKLCRPNQYFGIKAAQESIRNNEGGIIWHTQGSGKSLTMVWLAKWIREYNPKARVLIITDRDELDKQIEKVFRGVEEEIVRTKNGADLISKLGEASPWLLCSLIHKFGNKEEGNFDNYLAELKNALPKNFQPQGEFYVLVDECHRTQSGELNKAMRSILGEKALFIGFTGTPILKTEKKKSIEVFGKYIHTYKFDEAVKDGVVLDLRYEARDIEQKINSLEKVDDWFDITTKGLTEFAKTELKQKWGTLKKLFSSKERLSKIVGDILFDMRKKERLANGRGNALLVSGSIYNACRYYELFQQAGFKECAIVTSFTPNYNDIKGEETGEGYTEKLMQYEIYQKMLNGKNPEQFEDEVKKKFTEEPVQMKLLIVVDKLLTGFDAPPATYLYIDKTMKDHGLFQAICRVNRLDGDDKEYGYIIDYKDLFGSLETAIDDYTSQAFEGYDKEDVQGLLENRLAKAKERLEDALEVIRALCEPVEPPKETAEFIQYFCGNPETAEDLKEVEPKRVALYKAIIGAIRAYSCIAEEMQESGFPPKQAEAIKAEIKRYEAIRKEIQLASGDYVDLKKFEPAMRFLIDSYIGAEESKKISAFDDFSLVELLVENGVSALDNLPQSIRGSKEAMAETIENNLRKVIIEESPTNPMYYEKMSTLLDELIKLRKDEANRYEEYLKKIVELTKQIKKPNQSNHYPKAINTTAKRALFDNLNKNEELAIALNNHLLEIMDDEWRSTHIKRRKVEIAVQSVLNNFGITDEIETKRIYDLVFNQTEY